MRHPFDVLLSCYMQHFRAPDFALLCSDLPTLAGGYRRRSISGTSRQRCSHPRRAKCATRPSSATSTERDPQHRRVSRAAVARGRCSTPAQRTPRKGLHQHAELLAGRAARQLEIGGSLAGVREPFAPRCSHLLEPILRAGAMSARRQAVMKSRYVDRMNLSPEAGGMPSC